jgi:hypothetical protein
MNVFGPDSWRHALASWDVPRRARHATEAKRLEAAGWNPQAAAYLAYERIADGS